MTPIKRWLQNPKTQATIDVLVLVWLQRSLLKFVKDAWTKDDV